MVVTLLAAQLLEDGHQVELLTLDEAVAEQVVVERGRLKVTVLPRRPAGRGRDAYHVERAHLRAALRAVDADVLNPHWSYEYAMATSDHPAPRVVSIHDWAPSVLWYQPDPYRAIRLGMYLAALRGRPRVTVPSPLMARRVRRLGLQRISVAPNGLDASRIGPGPRRGPRGASLLSVADGFGRLKNTRALIQAMPLIRRRLPSATLTLVGPQHEVDGAAREYATAAGVLDGISFLGYQPNDAVTDLMRRADLLVHPAREESFGMVMVEAMAQGTPVIGGRRSGAVPWVLRGGAGTLVDVRSPTRLADSVAALLTDAPRWVHRSRLGYAAVLERFTMRAVADAYLMAYEAALAEDGVG